VTLTAEPPTPEIKETKGTAQGSEYGST